MPVWLRFILVFCFTLRIAAPTSHAQGDEDKLEAQQLIAKGSKLLAKGDALMKRKKADKGLNAYAEALAAYEAAYEAYNSPQIFLLVAIAEQKLGRYLEAMRHYETMLSDSSSDKLKQEAADAAVAGMKEVQAYLSALDITVEQDGATITIDEVEIGTTPLDGPYWVDPGEHIYTVTLKGYTAVEEVVELNGGEIGTRQVRLLALPITVVAEKEDDEVPFDTVTETATPSKTTLYASIGVSGTLLTAAIVTGLTASKRHTTFSDMALSAEERDDARKSGKNFSLATDLLVAGGLLAAGYGLFSYYTSYKPASERMAAESAQEEASLDSSSLWVAPYVSGAQAGMAMGASF